jgi:HD-like signal output (HDOD) protein
MTFKNIIKNIDSLPPLSNAAHLVQLLYSGGIENLNIKRLVKVIESDAMLAANILKMINSPYYGFKQQISTISQAVTLVGASRIQMLVINYAINEKLKADPSIYGFKNTQFNDLCQLQSSLMFQWYSTINADDAKFLSPLALIMESGKLVLANEVLKSDYVGEFRKGFNECESIEEYEKSIIGTTSYYITAMLFEHWNLEPKYVDILKSLDFPPKDEEEKKQEEKKKKVCIPALNVIRKAINVKDILSSSAINTACVLVEDMGQDPDVFKDIALKLREKYLS